MKKTLIAYFSASGVTAKVAEKMAKATGVGPQGLGGINTAVKVNVEWYPTHIAGLPVAININCHAARHASAEL